MNKKVYLTGQKGFIGGALLRNLNSSNFLKKENLNEEGFIIHYDNYNLNDDIEERKKLLSNTDCVVHCAASVYKKGRNSQISSKNINKMNVEITRKLAETAVQLGVKRFIFLSSIGVNGLFTNNFKSFTNKDIPQPIEDYSISKYNAEKVLWEISRKTGLEIVIIRFPLVYGEGTKGNFLRLLNLISKISIFPFGKINNLRSFIGIDNVVDLIACCINHPKASGQVFLASDDNDISTPNLIKKISKCMGKSCYLLRLPLFLLKLSSFIFGKSNEIERLKNSLQIDCSETKKILGWKPLTSLDDGLAKTVNWFLKKND